MKELIQRVFEDIRNDQKRFLIILAGLVGAGFLLLSVSMSFGYEMTNADIPCGFISCLILAITFHQYKLYQEEQ